MSYKQSTGPDLAAEVVALLGGKGKSKGKPREEGQSSEDAVTAESLKKASHAQLLEAAKKLGLSPASKIKKDALTHLVLEAWQGLTARDASGAGRPTASKTADPGADADRSALSHKFEVGESGRADFEKARQVPPVTSKEIPWGYGRDRVTAMPIDPDRLFAYWEVLDESIATARAQLGRGGAGAWLNLRVYDITGRIFDGTNAHSTFDHRVERGDRQWFFPIGRPTSELIVEMGMKSEEGYFAKIARSGRVEFPRREPALSGEPEWLTVRMAFGHMERGAGWVSGRPTQPAAVPAVGLASPSDLAAADVAAAFHLDGDAWRDAGHFAAGGAERQEWEEVHADGTIEAHQRFRWEGPATITSWEAGPFPYPVEIPEPVREAFVGKTRVFRLGARTHVVYGPWHVVIRGLDARQSRVVLSRWEVYRSWAEVTGHKVQEFGTSFSGGGASERMVGASDRRWMGGSEIRFGGSSELYFLKASETRLGGASERMRAGASEIVMRGSSERRFSGASERSFLGGSERGFLGASETRLGGAPETAARAGVAASPPARAAVSIYPPPPHFPGGDGGSSREGS